MCLHFYWVLDKAKTHKYTKKRKKEGKDWRKGGREDESPELPHPHHTMKLGLGNVQDSHPLKRGASYTEKVLLVGKSRFKVLLKMKTYVPVYPQAYRGDIAGSRPLQ